MGLLAAGFDANHIARLRPAAVVRAGVVLLRPDLFGPRRLPRLARRLGARRHRAGSHPLGLRRIGTPPVRVREVGAVPGFRQRLVGRVDDRDTFDAARRAGGVIDTSQVVLRQLVELVLVEAGKPVDAIAVEVSDERFRIRVEAGVADRQEEMLRLEPAARIHDDVVRPRRVRIDDEPLDVAEVLAGRTLDVHALEIDRVVVNVVGVNIPQPWQRMIHDGLPVRAKCAPFRDSKMRSGTPSGRSRIAYWAVQYDLN